MTDRSKIPASRLREETFDNKPISGSSNIISSGGVYEALKKKLGTTDTAIKAKSDAEGNEISKTYARISDVIFYEENSQNKEI